MKIQNEVKAESVAVNDDVEVVWRTAFGSSVRFRAFRSMLDCYILGYSILAAIVHRK